MLFSFHKGRGEGAESRPVTVYKLHVQDFVDSEKCQARMSTHYNRRAAGQGSNVKRM